MVKLPQRKIMSEWDNTRRWREILERRLNQIGSLVQGNQNFQADRIVDVVEQIEEVRQEVREAVARIDARMDKMKEWIIENVPKKEN